jgi:hypothetical protein
MEPLKSLILLALVLSVACNRSAPVVSEPDPETANRIMAVGDEYSARLIAELFQELNDALEFGGPAYAVDVCHLKAIPLTDSIGTAEIHSYDIKRTSSRFRNPENAPDEFERMAIGHYSDVIENGDEPPARYIQKIQESDKVYYYYYKPIMVGGICLNCHGDPKNIDPFVYATIREHYPDDRATGYASGDFRGLIRIKIQHEDI